MNPSNTQLSKAELKDIYDGYDEFMHTGLVGVFMDINHRLLNLGVPAECNANVLEIGGGSKFHLDWLDENSVGSYTVSEHRRVLEATPRHPASNDKLIFHFADEDPAYERLTQKYSRIVASHVLEHIPDPEAAILKWSSMLENDGVISIAIPCDPGWAWRTIQLVTSSKIKKVHGISARERDLIVSREHINAAQPLLRILRFYFDKLKVVWFPALVPVVDFNLVCFIQANRRDLRNAVMQDGTKQQRSP